MRPTSPPRGVALRHDPNRDGKRSRLRTALTILAALAVVGGLVRLALDDRVDPVAMPEPTAPGADAEAGDDARAPILSHAISALAAGSETRR